MHQIRGIAQDRSETVSLSICQSFLGGLTYSSMEVFKLSNGIKFFFFVSPIRKRGYAYKMKNGGVMGGRSFGRGPEVCSLRGSSIWHCIAYTIGSI